MTAISAIIIEDEVPVAKSLETLLNLNQDVEFKGMAHDITAGEELIRKVNPDVVFCDIQLGNKSTGFDLIERFSNPKFKLIFVTAFNEYAIKAFKYNAIDYLLKPIDQEELQFSIARAKKNIQENDAENQLKSLMEMMAKKKEKPKKLLFKTSEQIRAVDLEDIIRLESESNYTSVFLKGGKKLLVSKALKEYSDLLEDRNFFRAHQSHLINLDFFEMYEKQDGGYIILKDGTNIPLAKRKKNQLFELLENF